MPGWAFAANAVACCFTVDYAAEPAKDQLHLSAPAAKRQGMLREGLNYALSKPTIYWPWLMAGFVSVFAMSLPVLLAAFADHVYDVGAGGYGVLNTARGARGAWPAPSPRPGGAACGCAPWSAPGCTVSCSGVPGAIDALFAPAMVLSGFGASCS